MCQGLKCRFQCLRLVGQKIQARVEKVMEGVGRRGDNAGPWAARWWCSGKVMAWPVPSKLGWRLNAVGCAWAQAPKQVLCVLRCRKWLRKRRRPSATLTPSRDDYGRCWLPWVLCHLVWDGKGALSLGTCQGRLSARSWTQWERSQGRAQKQEEKEEKAPPATYGDRWQKVTNTWDSTENSRMQVCVRVQGWAWCWGPEHVISLCSKLDLTRLITPSFSWHETDLRWMLLYGLSPSKWPK